MTLLLVLLILALLLGVGGAFVHVLWYGLLILAVIALVQFVTGRR